jgi:NADH-quinone oxidoreductase subunit J
MNNINLLLYLASNFFFYNFYIFTAKSPIVSALYLIFSFINSSLIILFFFELEFLGFIFIIIYVGAIAILFLFVIMMVNVKKKSFLHLNEYVLSKYFYIILIFLGLEIYFIELYFLVKPIIFLNNDLTFDNITELNLLGQILYNYYNILFLIAGLILVVATVGPIALTLNFNIKRKNELKYKQLIRSDRSIIFFT